MRKNISVKLERVQMNKLHAKLYFQNETPNQKRVEQIASNFDWNLFQPLDVSFRDGRYNVADGMHRLSGANLKFGINNTSINLPCLVRYGLTESEEMELFVELAKNRRKVKPMEIYKALYGAGNELVVTMVDAINNEGLLFDFKESKSTNRITAIESINDIFGKLGKHDFIRYISLIKKTWNGDPVSLQRFMLYGVYEFFKVYKNEFDEKRFVDKLSTYSPIDIQREGKSDLVAEGYTGYTKSIVKKYNKSLTKNKLDIELIK